MRMWLLSVLPLSALAAMAMVSAAGMAQTEPLSTNAASPEAPAVSTMPVAVDIKIRSLFFTPAEVADIRYAVNIYRKNTTGQSMGEDMDEEDFLNKLVGMKRTTESNRYFQYPQFFLESLVYHTATNWIIWVNGQKLTQASPVEGAELSVLAIDKDKVSLLWRPVLMERVNATWSQLPEHDSGVMVHDKDKSVQFTLRPNQTFSSYVMSVLEGKMAPVTVDTQTIQMPEEVIPRQSELPAELSENQDKKTSEENKEGLTGLIGAYGNIDKTIESQGQPAAQEKKP